MSLLKSITNSNGIVTNYHRIECIHKDEDILEVNINSYVSEEYRAKEKSLSDMKEEMPNKQLRMAQLTGLIELSEEEQAELDEINAWFEEYRKISDPTKKFYAMNNTIQLNWTEDTISFDAIYTKLKTIDDSIFKDAEDC